LQNQNNIFDTPIEYIKGVGPQRGESLKKELKLFTLNDLIGYFPFRYIDRTKFYTTQEISDELPFVQLKGYIKSFQTLGEGNAKRMSAIFKDESGSVELVWFKGLKWIEKTYFVNTPYIVFGKASKFGTKFNIVHPEIEVFSPENVSLLGSLQPVYNSTELLKNRGLDSRGISKIIKSALAMLPQKMEETLSIEVLERLKFVDRLFAIQQIHFPTNVENLKKSEFRLKFEELFFLQLNILRNKVIRNHTIHGHIFEKVGNYFNSFYHNYLPFELTNAQKRVIKEIRSDTITGKQMNRLLQGDVGSGKTVVALLCMLLAKDNGAQSCLMAPTEILAQQHYNSLSELINKMDLKISLLTGSTKKKEKNQILEQLQAGEIDFIIGTHALIEDPVIFKNLGLVVIDEQHRFGVAQRAALWKKNIKPPHVLVMTATPIPRTLAMTLYGDLDVSIIDELPPGRKPIKTVHYYESKRLALIKFLKDEIAKGRQIYIVYPLIKESEAMDYADLEAGFEAVCRDFPLPNYKVSIVHGKMKPKDKDYEMQQFVEGKTNIMVATTVIEVGVNVPNASVMVIESTERFGLSQLHQLRGRVGRGAEQSYCILMTGFKLSHEARVRIETMCNTNDGFEISEVDLKLRGPGDIDGTQQSGILDMKIADLAKDQPILKLAREFAIEILDKDSTLTSPDNLPILKAYKRLYQGKALWSKIS